MSANPYERLIEDEHVAAASAVHVFSYERTSDVNPFINEPKSGSSCGAAELQWLQVDILDGLSPDELVDDAPDFRDNSDVPELLEECFGVDWAAVMNEEYDTKLSMFYDDLRTLGTRPVDIFVSSPPLLQPPALSSGENESLSAISTPSQLRRRRRSSPGSGTIKQKDCQDSDLTPTKSTPTSSKTPVLSQYSSPALPQPRTPTAQLISPANLEEANPPRETSDSTYEPSLTPPLPSNQSQSSYYDKSEFDVVPAARGFLRLMRMVLSQSPDKGRDMEVQIKWVECTFSLVAMRVFTGGVVLHSSSNSVWTES